MHLPIRFPDDAEVIAEEVARFRALSSEGQEKAIREMCELYHRLAEISGRQDVLARLEEEEKEQERKAILDFVARHDGR
jgi:hypothetical protein